MYRTKEELISFALLELIQISWNFHGDMMKKKKMMISLKEFNEYEQNHCHTYVYNSQIWYKRPYAYWPNKIKKWHWTEQYILIHNQQQQYSQSHNNLIINTYNSLMTWHEWHPVD